MAEELTLSDEQILADPSSHSVEDVVAVLGRSSPEQVSAAQEIEAQGKDRKGVTGWEPPSPASGFDTDEKHGKAGWKERSGWFGCSPHAIAGALDDAEPGQTFTQAQVAKRVEKWLKREAS